MADLMIKIRSASTVSFLSNSKETEISFSWYINFQKKKNSIGTQREIFPKSY